MGAPTAASTRGGKLLAGFESRMIWVDSSTTKYLYFVLAMCSARMELYIHRYWTAISFLMASLSIFCFRVARRLDLSHHHASTRPLART